MCVGGEQNLAINIFCVKTLNFRNILTCNFNLYSFQQSIEKSIIPIIELTHQSIHTSHILCGLLKSPLYCTIENSSAKKLR